MFKELLQHYDLLLMIAMRDIKLKYKQSVMGFMWAIFMPILTISAGVLVKAAFSKVSGKPLDLSEIVTVAVKSLPWTFFISSIKFANMSLVGNSNLINKIYFPRVIFPIAAVLSNLFDFIISSIVLIIILSIAKIGLSIYILWLPVILIFMILLVTGFGIILSCGTLFFRDVKYIVEVIVTFAIFFTPVFYEATMFGKWGKFLLLNPIGAILENINYIVILHKPPDLFWLGYIAIWAIGGLIIFWKIFNKAEPSFAENI